MQIDENDKLIVEETLIKAITCNFKINWVQHRDYCAQNITLQKELLLTLEQKELWDYLEEAVFFLFKHHKNYEPDNQKNLLEYVIFCARRKEEKLCSASKDNNLLLETAITAYFNLTSDYKDIPIDTKIIIAEFLLQNNFREFFFDLTEVLFKQLLMSTLTIDTGYSQIADKQITDKQITDKQNQTLKGVLIGSICLNIAWLFTNDNKYFDLYDKLKQKFNEIDNCVLINTVSESNTGVSGGNSNSYLQNRDVYLKQIPPDKWHLKSGMNICVICDFNIAGGLTSLMRGINKYSEHKARCIIWHDDHFSYDKDIILDECQDDYDEPIEIVQKADFFHFGRYVFNFAGIDFNKILNPSNCVVSYYGTFLRENGKLCNEWHKRTGIQAITGSDFTITPLLDRSFYHIGNYFCKFGDMEDHEIPRSEKPEGVVKIIAGSAGSPIKRYDLLEKSVQLLQAQGYPVEIAVIKGLCNEDFLLEKQKCHITFTSLHGGWGLSGVESMWLCQPVMCLMDPFVLSLYPDQPTVIVNHDNLTDQIKKLVKDPEKIMKIGNEGREFVKKHFRTKDIIKRYLYLFDLIMNYDLYIKGAHQARTIYDF